MYRAEFVVTENGKKPFQGFVESLSEDEQSEIFASIDKLCELLSQRVRLPEKFSKYMGDGIFELKVSHLNRTSRSFYFYIKDKTIVFTHGFIKKKQRTPSNEIKKAINLREIYLKINEVI